MPIYILIFLLVIILILIICYIIIQSVYNKNVSGGAALTSDKKLEYIDNMQNMGNDFKSINDELTDLEKDISIIQNTINNRDNTPDSVYYPDTETDILQKNLVTNNTNKIAYYEVTSTLHGFRIGDRIQLDELQEMLKNNKNVPNGRFIDNNGKVINNI
jgi:hypothetical protein